MQPTKNSIHVIRIQPSRQRTSSPLGCIFAFKTYNIKNTAPPVSIMLQCVRPLYMISKKLYATAPNMNTNVYSLIIRKRSPLPFFPL